MNNVLYMTSIVMGCWAKGITKVFWNTFYIFNKLDGIDKNKMQSFVQTFKYDIEYLDIQTVIVIGIWRTH